MHATDFEFRFRPFFIGAVFALGFNLRFGRAPMLLVLGEDHAREIAIGGAAIVVLAALLRTWATAYMRSDVVHDARLHAERVVADGPYRHVRNPLYLGILLLAAGLGVLATPLGYAVMLVLMYVFQLRITLREERLLEASRGDEYRAYRRAVPRLFFSPWPRLPSGATEPRVGQGLLGELFMWGFALAMIAYAVTFSMTVFATGGAIAWLGFFAAPRAKQSP